MESYRFSVQRGGVVGSVWEQWGKYFNVTFNMLCLGNVQTGEGTKHDCIIWLSIAKPPKISQTPSLSHYPPPKGTP